ncbi:MAG: RDD family protein [Bdellovibrionales bacterium]|nr:RDD family protein [Bdellovibrionales bacterium]
MTERTDGHFLKHSIDPMAQDLLESRPAYAGMWIRLFAFLLDEVVVNFCYLFLVVGYIMSQPELRSLGAEAIEGFFDTSQSNLVRYALIFRFIYYSLFESSALQATPGKLVTGIVVVDHDSKRIGFRRAMLRSISKMLDFFTISLGFLMVSIMPKKRAIHDFVAGTFVVHRSQLGTFDIEYVDTALKSRQGRPTTYERM